MLAQSFSVGDGLSRALARAAELRTTSPWHVQVKIVTQFADLEPGVIIVARIAARTRQELEAQAGKGVRHIPFADLDSRAHQLVDLVDAAAAEIETAVARAPIPRPRPYLSAGEVDGEAYEDLIDESQRAMLECAGGIVENVEDLSPSVAVAAVVTGALRVAALAAIGATFELPELVDTLKFEFANIRSCAGFHDRPDVVLH